MPGWRSPTPSGSETITLGSSSYQNAVRFHAGTPGDYLVRVGAIQPSSIVVAPSLGSQFLRAAPWLALAGFGGLLVVGGVTWLIVALVRRRRVDRPDPWDGPTPAMAPGTVPPGPWLPRNYDPFPAPGPPPGAAAEPAPPPAAQPPQPPAATSTAAPPSPAAAPGVAPGSRPSADRPNRLPGMGSGAGAPWRHV